MAIKMELELHVSTVKFQGYVEQKMQSAKRYK